MLQENDPEEDIPSDTDEYVEQSPDGRWYRRDQPVRSQHFIVHILRNQPRGEGFPNDYDYG